MRNKTKTHIIYSLRKTLSIIKKCLSSIKLISKPKNKQSKIIFIFNKLPKN